MDKHLLGLVLHTHTHSPNMCVILLLCSFVSNFILIFNLYGPSHWSAMPEQCRATSYLYLLSSTFPPCLFHLCKPPPGNLGNYRPHPECPGWPMLPRLQLRSLGVKENTTGEGNEVGENRNLGKPAINEFIILGKMPTPWGTSTIVPASGLLWQL